MSPVTLSWERQGPSYQFKVLYRARGSDDTALTSCNPTRETSFSLKDLAAGTEYQFCVETLSVKGSGPRCQPILFKTMAGRPKTAPTGVSPSQIWCALRDERGRGDG